MTTSSKDFIQRKIQLALKNLENLETIDITEQSMKDVNVYSKVYYLYQNVIERCLGLATYLIKDNDFSLPGSARESFLTLSKMKVISESTAEKLSGAYGMRNAIIHDYDNFQVQLLIDNHLHNLENLRQFLKEVVSYVE